MSDDLVERLRAEEDDYCFECNARFICGEAADEIERLHSWEGILSLLDEHYPADIFDGSSGDPGPTIIVLTREIERLRETYVRTKEVHYPLRGYWRE